jgi:hypothetical protein
MVNQAEERRKREYEQKPSDEGEFDGGEDEQARPDS